MIFNLAATKGRIYVHRTLAILAISVLTAMGSIGLAKAMPVTIEATGVIGSGVTTWSFSGSSIVGGNPLFMDDVDGGTDGAAVVPESFFSDLNENNNFVSTNVMMTTDETMPRTFDILGVGRVASGPNFTMNFGFYGDDTTSPASNYNFAVGTTLSFSGSGMASIDISEFAPGTTLSTVWDNNSFGQPDAMFDITWVITPTRVPEPSALVVFGLGLAAIGIARRRRAA